MTTAVAPLTVAPQRRVAVDRGAVTDALPVVAALAPFALVIGVAVGTLPGSPAAGLSGSLLLYAGSAQLSAISLIHDSAAVVSVVAAIALVNARFLVYSAALAPHFAGQPAWFRWGAAHFIVDPTFGLVAARDDLQDPARFRRYWLTINTIIAVGWVGMMTVGAVVGPVVPNVAAVQFLPTAAFLTMLAPAMKGRPAVAAAVVAAAVTVVIPTPGATRILIGLLSGAVAGVVADVARGRLR